MHKDGSEVRKALNSVSLQGTADVAAGCVAPLLSTAGVPPQATPTPLVLFCPPTACTSLQNGLFGIDIAKMVKCKLVPLEAFGSLQGVSAPEKQ